MKTYTWLLICLAVIAGVAEGAQKKSSKTIAELHSNGSVVLKSNILRKTFRDGGVITAFEVVKLNKGYYLQRRGTTVNGVIHTEWIPLRRDGSNGLLLPLGRIVVVSCASGDCGNSSCALKRDGSSCVCESNGACVMSNLVLPGTQEILTQ